jgi:S1-C subfamily serine protease
MHRLLWSAIFVAGVLFGTSLALVQPSHLVSTARAHPAEAHLASMDIGRVSDQFEGVARQCSPSVVYVEAIKPSTAQGAGNKPLEESGSGVIIAGTLALSSTILTNNHVIAGASPHQITVSTADGRLFHPARVWADPESDVAVLRLDGVSGLPSLPLGDSDQVRVGQWVVAIGSPFGLNQTVTHGIISARERGEISLGSTIRIKDFLQTDAAINPGSSGGPLISLNGEVIGINTAIASHNGNNSGVAFSIPINLVKLVMRQLLEKGNVSRGYLGMQLAQSFEPGDAFRLGLDRVHGALVEVVYPNTPAADAGLRANDVVTDLNGTTIRGENQLINLISAAPAGQRVRLRVWRDRREETIEAVIGDWSKAQDRFRPQS